MKKLERELVDTLFNKDRIEAAKDTLGYFGDTARIVLAQFTGDTKNGTQALADFYRHWTGAQDAAEKAGEAIPKAFDPAITKIQDMCNDELQSIVTSAGTRLGFELPSPISQAIAKRSRGTARIAVNNLLWYRDCVQGDGGVVGQHA